MAVAGQFAPDPRPMQSHLALLFGCLGLVLPAPGDLCDYKCEDSGACTVKYVGPSRPGKKSGEYICPHHINPILDTRISVRPSFVRPLRSGEPPPWILKRGVLESYGPRLISLNYKIKIIAFFSLIFFAKKILKKKGFFFFFFLFFHILEFFYIFDVFRIF